MVNLYKLATENRPPQMLDRAGTAVFEAMDSVVKKVKKKKRKEVAVKNALSDEE